MKTSRSRLPEEASLLGRLFGTNGVRGIVGESMVPGFAMDLGRALASYLAEARGKARPRVAVGRDFRTSSPLLVSALGSGLMTAGSDVRDLGILPTPALQHFVKTRSDVSAGAVVTASHNPPRFNGIKFIESDGTEMAPGTEEEIEQVFFDRAFRASDWQACGSSRPVEGYAAQYNAAIAGKIDRAAVREADLTVVVDCSNGAGCVNIPDLVGLLGARVVTLNANGDGRFPGHESEPSPQHAQELAGVVRQRGAALGCIVDGDADRAIFVDENGAYVWGDRSLALLAGAAVQRAGGGKVATPVATSSCVERYVESKGGEVVYTVVGAPRVARAMIEMKAVAGGEENGGVLFPEHQYCRDASMTLARMIELVAKAQRPLSELLAEVPELALIKTKVEVPDDQKDRVLGEVRRVLRAGSHGVERVVTDDGVKAFFADGGWVLVRPSGTEAIFRIIAEGETAQQAERLAGRERDRIAKMVS